MEIKNLIALVVILFLAHKIVKHMQCGCKKVEQMENTSECSQHSINESYKEYIFGAPNHFVR
jgi:hypothetical protein